MTARYAIYFVPPADTALYRFGAAALGYDCYGGAEVASFGGEEIDAAAWRALTAEPRRYGFHATFKAPFRLRDDASERDLAWAFERFAAAMSPVRFAATIGVLDGFAAVLPGEPAPDLDALAAHCVTAFDAFRGPMSADERTRWLELPLTRRQIDHLDRWGYPYVFEDFRFHMTLSGRLPAERVSAVLARLHAALKRDPVPRHVTVSSLALSIQAAPSERFRVIHAARLGPPAAQVLEPVPEATFI